MGIVLGKAVLSAMNTRARRSLPSFLSTLSARFLDVLSTRVPLCDSSPYHNPSILRMTAVVEVRALSPDRTAPFTEGGATGAHEVSLW